MTDTQLESLTQEGIDYVLVWADDMGIDAAVAYDILDRGIELEPYKIYNQQNQTT